MLCTVVLLALFASAQGRAVNISNTWVLPEEGFPVFYRYFRDRISWYEADAVCQFHHANLVTVDTTAQYDAVRAYLKELDISSAVWVGLIRSNPNGDFTWTDYHGLSGDGYWSSAPDPRVAPLCAAADPTADYRWKARSCGGPTVASFICELPVPQWALGNEGCMVRALPALTILYLPESASVQLTADCGLAGVKRIQCTGNVKRQDLLRDLSCTEEEEATTMVSITTSGTTWSTTNESVFTDQEMTAETMNDYNVTTEQQRDNNEHSTKTSSTPPNIYINPEIQTSMKPPNPSKLNRRTDIILKHVELDLYNNNSNLHSNHIPKIANAENYLSNEQLDKIEDEKHMQHKMLHEEIARQGNLENIFTQPTDHFVPPLVMAKAKISNDMTVLSIQEKHAQQMAEHHLLQEKSQYKQYDNNLKINNVTSTTENSKVVFQSIKSKDYMKKGKNKPTMPKKYNEKVFDSKGKLQKIIETNPNHLEKLADFTVTSTESSIKYTTTYLPLVGKLDDEGDSSLNLTVLLKDVPGTQDEKSFYNYSGDISRLETMNIYSTQRNETEIRFYDLEATEQAKQEHSGIQYQNKIQNLTFSHDNVKAFTVSDVNTSTIPQDFEISSKIPVFEAHQSINPLVTITNENTTTDATTTKTIGETTAKPFQTTVIDITADLAYSNLGNDTVDTIENDSATSKPIIKMELPIPRSTIVNKQMSEMEVKATDNNTQSGNSENTKSYDAKLNFQEELGANLNTTDAIDDYNSPLLSGANVPPHRPYRSRRPQPQPSRNKFNPFRILG